MPPYYVHAAAGLSIWAAYAVLLPVGIIAGGLALAIALIGSVVPDIDERHSYAFRRLRLVLFIAVAAASFFVLQAEPVMRIAISTSLGLLATIALYAVKPRHRGVIHTHKAGAVYGSASAILAFLVLSDALLALLVGLMGFLSFSSHLLLDRV